MKKLCKKMPPKQTPPPNKLFPPVWGFLENIWTWVFFLFCNKSHLCVFQKSAFHYFFFFFLLDSWGLSGKSNIKLNILWILDGSPDILRSVCFCSPTPLVFPIIQVFQYPQYAEGFFWKIQIITPCCSPHLFASRKTMFSAWSALLQ